MSEHQAIIEWHRDSADFSYDTYNRTHSWQFDDGTVVPASAAPAFNGGLYGIDPEEALVAATSSCHMLTFLAICAKKGLAVERYYDKAVGVLAKNESGKLAITQIALSPQVTFSGERQPDPAELQGLHESAHRNCFIANSINATVIIG